MISKKLTMVSPKFVLWGTIAVIAILVILAITLL